jgi:hypothetical protein
MRATLYADYSLPAKSRAEFVPKSSVEMLVAQRALAVGAHPALARSEKQSAFVALPGVDGFAEDRWHYTIASVCAPLQDVPGLSSTGAPICAASMQTMRR